MSAQYDFQSLNVEKTFKSFYIVPDYQREYVWQADQQVDQLLNDVYDAFEDDPTKEYFLGSTVVFDNGSKNELIDGQQRLTTLFLILCAFRNIYQLRNLNTSTMEQVIQSAQMAEDGITSVIDFHLELQYEDSKNVIRNIYNNAIPEKLNEENSASRLYRAYLYIKQFITEKVGDDTATLGKLFMHFFKKLVYIQIKSPDINDSLKIFETINDRGVGLNPMDLLKNLVFRQVGRDKFYTVKDKWQTLVKILEDNKEKPLRFLRYFIMSNYASIENSPNKSENVVREDEIYMWMSKHVKQTKMDIQPVAFVDRLIENANCYVNFAHGKDVKGEQNVYLDNILRLSGNAFHQHLIVLLAARHFDNDMFNTLCKAIEVYLFYYLFTREQAKIFEKQFAKWDLSITQIKCLDDLTAFIDANVKPLIERKQAEYKGRFMTFSSNDWQQYRVRYVLSKMAQYVDNYRKGITVEESLAPYYAGGIEIEHIMPQTPLAPISITEEEYQKQISMLGNLTLIEKSINASIHNDPFNKKVVEYGKSNIYLTRSISSIQNVGNNTAINRINDKLLSFDHWDSKTIGERQEMLYNLSLNIWKI